LSASSLQRYIEKIKRFYEEIAEVAKKVDGFIVDFKQEKAYHCKQYLGRYKKVSDEELRRMYGDDIPSPEWLFEYYLRYRDPWEFVRTLRHVAEKGYEIAMNFYASDVILGNVAVKIDDKWFAFGECRNEGKFEQYITEIWPLSFVLSDLQSKEVQLRYVVSVL